MYDQAVAIVLQHRRASISLVQRHLRIGYNRAARLLEQMEKSGTRIEHGDQRQPRHPRAGARRMKPRIGTLRRVLRACVGHRALSGRGRRAADAVDTLQDFVRDVKSGRAAFTQTVTAPDGAKKKTSSGSFEFSRPNRFRFAYAKPFEQTIVADGQKVWIYDADLNQVSSRKRSRRRSARRRPRCWPAARSSSDFDLARAARRGRPRLGAGDAEGQGRRASSRCASAFAARSWPRSRSSTASASARCCSSRSSPANVALPAAAFQFVAPAGADVIRQSIADAVPLAERLRPQTLDEVIGQQHLLGPGKPLRVAFESGRLHSMILWGPPGIGKTTLARLMAEAFDAQFIAISAVLGGVKDIREAVERARRARPQRPAHGRLRRRGAPLQQGAAGRLPAARRVGPVHLHRRDHREPVVRGQLGAAVARDGACAEAADRCRPRASCSTARAALLQAPPLTDAARDAADRLCRRRRAAAAQRLREPGRHARGRRRGARSTRRCSSRRSASSCAATTRAASSSTTRSRRCTRRCAAATRTRAVLVRAHARRRRRPALCGAPPGAHGQRGHRPGRPARAAAGARRGRDLRAARLARGRAGAWRRRSSTSRSRRRATRSTRPATRRARSSSSDGTRPVPLRLRNAPTALMKDLDYGTRLSLRARRGRRLRRRRALLARRAWRRSASTNRSSAASRFASARSCRNCGGSMPRRRSPEAGAQG